MITPARLRFVSLALLCCLLPAGGTATAQENAAAEVEDRFGDVVSIFSGDIHIPAGLHQHGSVVCLGGEARIEGEVDGDVVVILGSLENHGTVQGSVTGVLTEQHHSDARIDGELVSVLGSIELERTRVTNKLVNILGTLKSDATSSTPSVNFGFGSWFPSLLSLFFWLRLLRLLAIFVLLLLLAALVPERIRLIGEEAPVRYALAFFVGLLGYLGLLVVVGLLAATVVGLPLAIFLYAILKWLGIAGIFFAVGRRLGRALGRDISLLGAVMLSFGLYVLITLAPTPLGLFGLVLSGALWLLFFFVIQVPAVGLVLLTWAGGRSGRTTPFVPPNPP